MNDDDDDADETKEKHKCSQKYSVAVVAVDCCLFHALMIDSQSVD